MVSLPLLTGGGGRLEPYLHPCGGWGTVYSINCRHCLDSCLPQNPVDRSKGPIDLSLKKKTLSLGL